MKKIFIILAAFCALTSCTQVQSDTKHLRRADDFGRIDGSIHAYLEGLRGVHGTGELNSLMVLKDGEVLAEYYDNCYGPDFRNICWSASKSFTSTAIGFAIQDGLLTLDSKLVDFLDEDMLPETISDTLAGLNVYDLLRMASGLRLDPIGDTGSGRLKNPTRTVLEGGFKFAPGTQYAYNSHNTYFLSVIVTKVTGKLVSEYLQEKLFDELGIRNYVWEVSAEGYEMGGWGLYITTEGLAKMGQFYLQKGKWNGKQLLNEEWCDQAMGIQIIQKGEIEPENERGCGYGYQMWKNTVGGGARFDGAHGQFVLICPDKNAVIVLTGNTTKPYDAIKYVWSEIYAAI